MGKNTEFISQCELSFFFYSGDIQSITAVYIIIWSLYGSEFKVYNDVLVLTGMRVSPETNDVFITMGLLSL